MGKGWTKILIGSLATCLPKLPYELKLASSQRCHATLYEKTVLAGKGRKMKGQTRKPRCLYNTKQRPATALKKLENVLSAAKHGMSQCAGHARRALPGAPHVLICQFSLSSRIIRKPSCNMIGFALQSKLAQSKFTVCRIMILTDTC